MAVPETVLLEIIDTGPCEQHELMQIAPELVNGELYNVAVRPSQIPVLVDELDGKGYIGRTGSHRDIIVISQLGKDALDLN